MPVPVPVPVPDWTKMDAGVFHDFHTAWLVEIRNALNSSLLRRVIMRWRNRQPA